MPRQNMPSLAFSGADHQNQPRGMSQKADILRHLQTHGSISPMTALERFGCFRLAARVRDLRAEGHAIETKMTERNGKEFAVYRMENKEQLELL